MSGTQWRTAAETTAMIRDLNDAFRKDLRGGKLLLSSGIIAKLGNETAALLRAISDFDHFSADDDPYGEHDFGCMSWQGDPIFWKIDYLDADTALGSPDPADPDQTVRVLTVMMAWEY